MSFRDASSITYSTTTLSETAANDGTVGGSIVATLSGDTFTSEVVSGNHVYRREPAGGSEPPASCATATRR